MTSTALTTNTPEAIGSYFSLYRELLTATHYTCLNTGKLIPLTLEKKVIWCWMIDRFMFFEKQRKSFFDNQKDIADSCGVSERTVRRFIAELTDGKDKDGKPLGAGYIHITCTRSIGGHSSNSYVLLSDLVLVQPEKAPKKPVQAKSEKTNAIAAPAQQNAVEELTEPYSDSHIPAGESFATEYIPYDDSEPDWVVATLQDDGSMYDAMTFKEEQIVSKTQPKNSVELEDIAKPTPKKENEFDTVISKEMPLKRFNHNGQPSYEMRQWCESQGISPRFDKGEWIFRVEGKDCSVCADGFIPYVPAPAMTATPVDPWAHIPEPF